ncbi:hypothetical protein G9A89_017171 [Geosiphon pyriformis]|nr:hypothetical protein G9A89_017171 [Geosiphon pyriformis]
MAKSEEIETNYLGFVKSLFQHYHTHLRLTNNNWPTESAFNYYINKKIVYYLEGQGDPESVFNNFFSKLFQSIILPQNYLFALLITKINKKIKRYTKQRFLITFADKGKRKFNLSANLLYYHIFRSTINITNATKASVITLLNRIPFQSKQKKTELLETYSDYFEKFKLQSPIPSGIRLLPPQPDFGANDLNSDIINQQNLPSIIEINLPPILPIAKQQQQPQLLSQQQIKKFTSKKNDVQIWLNNMEKAIAKDFKLAELKTNHAQAVNLVINELSDLDSKLKQLKDATSHNLGTKQKQPLTNNILPATITKNELLTTIFSFELEKPAETPLFNRATLELKPITAMYTDAKVDRQHIKLILDSRSADSIIT